MIELFAKAMKYRPEDSKLNYTLFDLDDYDFYDDSKAQELEVNLFQPHLFDLESHEIFKAWPICGRYLVGDHGTIMRRSIKKQRVLSGHINRGRKCVCLSVAGTRIDIQISRMVCETFHGVKDTKIYDAHHKNGNRLDNRSANLEWLSTRIHRKHHKYEAKMGKIRNSQQNHG